MYPPTCPPLSGKRITPLFPSNQTLKVEVFSSLPLSENLVGGSTFQQKGGRGGLHTMYHVILYYNQGLALN